MSIVAGLWLALFHALLLATTHRSAGEAASSQVGVEQAVGVDRRLSAEAAQIPEEALRAPRNLAASALPRATRSAPPSGGYLTAAIVLPARVGLAARDARQRLRRHGAISHSLAARGSLLPYFPTAPPHQG